MIELKPCPFCGGEAEIERIGTRRQSCIIACTECGCRHEGADEGDRCGSEWNCRHTPDCWQLVPVDPTSEMSTAGGLAVRIDTTAINKLWTANKVWQDMLKAAPKPGGPE